MTKAEKINSFLYALFGFKKTGSKSHIALMVLIHLAAWCILFFLPLLLYPVRIVDKWFLLRETVDKSILVVLFYLNYYLFIPKFFERKRYLAYTSLVLLAFGFYFTQHVVIRFSNFPVRSGSFRMMSVNHEGPSAGGNIVVFGEGTSHGVPGPRRGRMLFVDSTVAASRHMARVLPGGDSLSSTFSEAFPLPETFVLGIPRGLLLMAINNSVSSFALLLLIGGFIRLAYSFIRNQNEKKVLENANLNAEINFLRSQINPHFLFNTLNSIYAQAHSRSDNTEFSILKLSEILRYVLYDSGEDKVELEHDIQYINNYIDFQRLRLSNRIQLQYSVTGNTRGKTIAPLLLISFIENAFKHGISYTHPSRITIIVEIFEETLTLMVSNPIIEKDSFAPGGLGLKNVTRRLELLYPNRHLLEIDRRQDLYIVNLKLDLGHA